MLQCSNYKKFKRHRKHGGYMYAAWRGIKYANFLVRRLFLEHPGPCFPQASGNAIAQGPLKIVCADRGIKIFWNNAEVTSGAGLNVSINTLGLWTDSTRAEWRILEQDEHGFKIKVVFKELPLSQNWIVSIAGQQIHLDIDMEIEEWLFIEELRILCLISPRYKSWLSNFHQQDFPRQNRDWQHLCMESVPALLIGARFPIEGEFLPAVVLEPCEERVQALPLVHNPPSGVPLHIIGLRNVLLQGKKEFYPGRYHLFSGRVTLMHEESLLDNKIEKLRQDYLGKDKKERNVYPDIERREKKTAYPLGDTTIGAQLCPGKIIFPPEIREIASGTSKTRLDLIKYEEYKELDVIGKYVDPDRRKQPLHYYPAETPCIYLCGDNSEVHRWGVGLDENDFFKQVDKLRELSLQGKRCHIVVGVRRTNFYRLHRIYNMVGKMKNQESRKIPFFDIKPLRGIRDRFYQYLGEINTAAKEERMEFRIEDAQVDRLLTVIEENAARQCFHENNFLRALGTVCKDVFTGPAFILLDLAGRCNLDCVYCRRFSPFIQKSWEERHPEMTGFLDFKVIRNVLAEAKEIGVESVLIVGGGEPTIHPKFFEIINLVKSLGMNFNFSTNGTTLDVYNKYLVDGRCENVTVSMSFVSQESFRKIRPNADAGLMRKIEKGVRNLADLKQECLVSLPQIIALYAVCKYNYKEVAQMALHAKRLGADKIWYQLVHLEDFSKKELFMNEEEMAEVRRLLSEAKELSRELGLIFDPFIEFEMKHYDGARGDWSKGGLLYQGCFVGWHFVFIHLNLEVCMCCGMKTLGVLNEQGGGLKELWFSDAYKRFRNDGLIMHKENPLTLHGRPLYEAFCDSCDNHDQNEKMIAYIKEYGLEEFLERHND